MNRSFDRPSLLVAFAAHELWRAVMLDEGWKHGPMFNRYTREHDALLPFEQLPAEIQADVEFEVVASGVLEQLREFCLHPRGPGELLTPSAAAVGVRVQLPGGAPLQGTVIGCTVNVDYAWPEYVHVRWDNGVEETYVISAGDLVHARPEGSP
jgi:hypothetical protein